MLVRPAALADAPALHRILAEEIPRGYAHFAARPPTSDELTREILDAPPHVLLVADAGEVVGFARSTAWKSREAYAWTAEIGVYVAGGHRGTGVGRALVEALIEELRARGFRTLLAGIALPNDGSVALFEGLGFARAGTLPAIGYKQGAWRDVGYWSLALGDGPPWPRDLPIVQVDAFADRLFEGNPAAVVRLPCPLPDATLQAIARENNLSETAFVLGKSLRWFTPSVEVDLCGHATLAAGAVLLDEDGGEEVAFETRSGTLRVRREDACFSLDLPVVPHGAGPVPPAVLAALGAPPLEAFPVRALHHAAYWMAVYARAEDVLALAPDIGALRALRSNVICTAPGAAEIDFVSRFFAPGSGVDEDPVTGSAHATLTPFWAGRLGRNPLRARQLSARGGSLRCELRGDRVVLAGSCVTYLRGRIALR